MIGYVTLGTKDLAGHAPFYDAIAKELGVGRMMDEDTFIAWGAPERPGWGRDHQTVRWQCTKCLAMAPWWRCRRAVRNRLIGCMPSRWSRAARAKANRGIVAAGFMLPISGISMATS